MTPFVFVHIPKTAGTSFRIAAEKWFGKRQLIFDYGAATRRTSPVFRRYDAGEVTWQKVLADVLNARFVTGHFPINRYLCEIPLQNFCTFVRDPVERAVSQYLHHKFHFGYSDAFEVFIEDPRFHNQQCRLLSGVNVEDIGFVGVTEHYAESVFLFNSLNNTNFAIEVHNERKSKKEKYSASPALYDRIRFLNDGDVKLYRLAVDILKRRLDEVGSY